MERRTSGRPHKDAPTAIAFGEGVLATSCRDGSLKLHAVDDEASVSTTRSFAASPLALSCVALATDAKLVVAGGWDNHLVAYETDTSCLAARFEAHESGQQKGVLKHLREGGSGSLERCPYSEVSRELCTQLGSPRRSSLSSRARTTDASSGKELVAQRRSYRVQSPRVPPRHESAITSLALRGATLASGGSGQGHASRASIVLLNFGVG